jgi:hypothetical protein
MKTIIQPVYFIIIFVFCLNISKIKAQEVLYFEDFSNALLNNKGQNGTSYDMTGVSNWTINVGSGTFSAGDWFRQTTSGYFESSDTDASAPNPVSWYSTTTDITCFSNVTVSVDLGRQSANSGSGCRARYSIDGGAWITFGEKINADGTEAFQTYSASGLSGSTIQIRIDHWGTSATPYYRHDNVLIQGTHAYPSTQASGLNIVKSGTTADLSWTNGNGDAVIVVAKELGTSNASPTKGITYTANTNFGAGDETGPGNYVVYNGIGNTVTVSGLVGLDYEFSIYAFHSSGPCYNPNALLGSTACTQPAIQASGSTCGTITANTIDISWTNGSGDRVLVVARQSTFGASDPQNLVSYSANSVFGLGDMTGSGNYVVYDGTGTNASISGLTSNTSYTFAVYTYNSLDFCYNQTENSTTGTTLTISSPYLMNAINGMIIGTCSGNFYDSGGSGGTYSNNENFTTTFCSNSGLPLKFDFSTAGNFNMAAGTGDTLFFYSGMSATGTPIAILTAADDVPFSQLMINTISQCVTVVFKSNASVVANGWHAVISCGSPPVCLQNDPAADIFRQATPMCNIDSYCGTTAGYYGEDLPFNLRGGGSCPAPTDGIFAGTIENNSWLKFEALSTSASFNFNVPIGGGCAQGIQVAVFEFNETTKLFSLKSPCSYTDGAHSNTFTVTATGLTIGQMYYIMIDGNAGDQCNYTIGVNTGAAVANSGPNQAICETFTTLNAQPLPSLGTWSVISGTGVFSNPNDPNTQVTGLSIGTNIFRWSTTNALCGDIYDDVEITSSLCLPIELIHFKAQGEGNETIIIDWITASELNNDYFLLERSLDGKNFNAIARIEGNGTTNLPSYYKYYDNPEQSSMYYYRLMQTDYNGDSSTSNIITARFSEDYSSNAILWYYENENLSISFHSAIAQTFILSIVDITGKQIFKTSIDATHGYNTFNLNGNILPSGISILYLLNDQEMYNTKLIR